MVKAMSEKNRDTDQDEMVIDTSKMSSGQRKALEVAEAAREKDSSRPSFMRQLFMGTFEKNMLFPFPEQTLEDKKEADELIDKLSSYLETHLDPEEVDATRTIPDEVVAEMGRMGVFAMKVSKEYGGLGFSQVNYNRVMTMISSYCGSTAVLVSAHQSIGVPEPLKVFGTPEQKRKYLPRFREGAISSFALTEPDVGSDPAKMSTEAKITEDGKHYIINGQKLWCTNGPISNVMVVMAKTEPKMVRGKEQQQITAFIVENEWPGVEVVHRCDFMGIRGINNGLLRFTDVKVPVENIVWGKGRGLALALRTLNTGRLTIPAACTGMAKQALSICRRWGNERVQWGQPVGYHEAGRQKVAYIASMTFAMEAITQLTSHWADAAEFDIRFEAAVAKMYCSEAAWKIADLTLQFRGGRGYEKASSLKARGEHPYPVERMMRDCRINTIIEGTTEIMELFIAREALDPHLSMAKGLLKPGTGFGEKVKTAFKLLGYYATWYPKQWLASLSTGSYPEAGELETHLKFIEKHSHILARKLFQAMAKYQDKLADRQVLLHHLIGVGSELFAMGATVSYAMQKKKKKPHDSSSIALADHFCTLARRRVSEHLQGLKSNDAKASNDLAERALKGEMRWLEQGVIWCGPNE